jgi:hypothetical protein
MPDASVLWQLLTGGRVTRPEHVLGLIKRLCPQDTGKRLIRIGGQSDGGYLIPDDLEGLEFCFSPGTGDSVTFENDLANMGIRSFLADYSVNSPPFMRPEFTFDKKLLGIANDEASMTLSSWKNRYLPEYDKDLLLQMDIEGHEWQVIASIPDELLAQFRILVIEFHELQRLFDPFEFSLFAVCFQKLLNKFHVVHLHPNNSCGKVAVWGLEVPRVLEITLLNKKRVSNAVPVGSLPNRLDRNNDPRQASVSLPPYWYGR